MIMIKETDSSYMFVLGRVSYISQESWIQNTTIKNNILFGSDFDEAKYRQVIDASQLGPDLDILPGGDLTEIGEKGINLSGGQKSRVSIARAAYADTDVVLLDDPLSAVDAHVGREIFNRCIRKYMSGKTRILVTNGQQFLPYVDRIVVMDNGQIIEQGTYQELTESNSFFRENILVSLKVELDEEISTQKAPEEIKKTEAKSSQKNIIEAEDRAVGRVSWNVYSTYVKYSGGWLVVFFAFIFMMLWMADRMYTDIFLSEWTDASSQEQEENFTYYVVFYSLAAFSVNLFILVRLFITTSSGIRAAKTIFTKQLIALLNAPVNKFYDVTPSGRIMNRLSKDQAVIDGQLLMAINGMIGQVFTVFSIIVICSYVVPWVLIIVPISMFMSYKIQRFYLHSSRELMRLESISRSPIVQNFSETISGSETIRAYNYEDIFTNVRFI
jgi:ABC-type multidrug transport system fused ATPase/permease subunit